MKQYNVFLILGWNWSSHALLQTKWYKKNIAEIYLFAILLY